LPYITYTNTQSSLQFCKSLVGKDTAAMATQTSSSGTQPFTADLYYSTYKQKLIFNTDQIAGDWALLKKLFDKHYDEICQTWEKMRSVENRTKVIRQASSTGGEECPVGRRPDINGLRKEGADPDTTWVYDYWHQDRKAFLWPHLTQEDLIYGDIIPRFLYNRASHHWTEYCHTDLFSIRGGTGRPDFHGLWAFVDPSVETQPVESEFPTEAWTNLIRFKARNLDEVERIKKRPGDRFDDHCEEYTPPGAAPARMRGQRDRPRGRDALDKFTYSQALQVTKVQQRVYKFLVDVCLTLLYVRKGRKMSKLPVSVDQDQRSQRYGEVKEFRDTILAQLDQYEYQNTSYASPDDRAAHSEARMYEEAMPELTEIRLKTHYGPPEGLNWDSLQTIIESKVDDAKMTLLSLRREPDFFEEALRRERWYKDHGYGSKIEPQLEPQDGEFSSEKLESWHSAIKSCIGGAIKDFDRWTELQAAFDHFRSTYERHRLVLETRDKTAKFWNAAEELDTALYGFKYLAHEFQEQVLAQLKQVVLSHPYYQNIYQITKIDRKITDLNLLPSVLKEGPPRRINIFNKLRRLMIQDRMFFGLSALLDDLERERTKNSLSYTVGAKAVADNPVEDPENDPEDDVGNPDVPGADDGEFQASVRDAPEQSTSAANKNDKGKGKQTVGQAQPPEGVSQHTVPQEASAQEEGHGQEGDMQPEQGSKKKKSKKKKNKKKKNAGNEFPEYLTQDVLRLVAELSYFAECINQVEHFQPWYALYLEDWNKHTQKQAVRNSVNRLKGHFSELASDRPWKDSLEDGLPKNHRFYYPTGEEQTEHNVILLEQAEGNLDRFWEKLCLELGPDRQNALTDRARTILGQPPDRTPWKVHKPERRDNDVEMAEAQQRDLDEDQEGDGEDDAAKDVEMPDAFQPQTAGKKTPSPPKRPGEKDELQLAVKKTPSPLKRRREEGEEPTAAHMTPSPPKRPREEAEEVVEEEIVEEEQEEEEPQEQWPPRYYPKVPKFPKSAKGKKGKGKQKQEEEAEPEPDKKIVLSAQVYENLWFLIHIPNKQGPSGLKWKEVMRLYLEMGFSGRPSAGSIWMFTPTSSELVKRLPRNRRGGLAVHHPHPEPEVKQKKMRIYGNTMQRIYGFSLDWFESE
jgi:hypothetical protein